MASRFRMSPRFFIPAPQTLQSNDESSMNTQLAAKVVLVTGASGGIGSAIARAFAAEGAKVVLHYRSGRANITKLQSALKNAETLVVRADLSKESEVKRLFA